MAIKNSLFIIIVVQFFNCAGINYKKLSIENPAKLVAVQDSLLSVNGDNQQIRDALVTANNSVAKRYLNTGDLKLAIRHFNKSISIDGKNKDSNFGLLIAEGRILIKKGNKNGIWDAIEKFSKASSLFPRNGEPFYWMAKSYTKLGDTEFDLILESYEKSLALDLDEGLRLEVEKNYKIAKNRKSKLDSFWK
jgi:tetratricopeptide (TPR) repeat protein